MANAFISKRSVDAAKPGKADWFLWDAGDKEVVKGFGLKVTPSGGKVYVFQYRIARPGEASRTPAKRYTIGKHGSLTPDQARTRAKQLAAMVEEGIDPREVELDAITARDEADRIAAEKARVEGELSFENVAALWLYHYENEKGRRPSSVNMAKLVVNRHLKPTLAGKPMPHITRENLQAAFDTIPVAKRGMRRAVYAYASVLFGWAQRRGNITENPLRAMEKPEAPAARDRVLSDNELASIWNASDSLILPFAAFFRLLLLTGQRREEVSGMNWAELDRATAVWSIPAKRAKNGMAHIVPLSPEVLAELDALSEAKQLADAKAFGETATGTSPDIDPARWPKVGHVLSTTAGKSISGYSKAKAALDLAIAEARENQPLDAWRVHDLRRTLATGLQRLGIRFEVTEAVLNHVSGARSGVAGIYQRHDWKAEKRGALEAWGRHVAAIVVPAEETNVVPIGAAKQSA
jgi:integrase